MVVFQIGTCKANDDLTEILHNQEIDLLVLVEPLEIHNTDINECYKNIKNKYIENIAITSDPELKNTLFYYHKKDGPLYEVSSINKNHILKHGYNKEELIEINIFCSTINNLFLKYNVNNIDILYIDAEGADDSIIYSIDLNRFKIDQIYFENLHLNTNTDTNVYNYLEKNNYSIIKHTGLNGWSSLAKRV